MTRQHQILVVDDDPHLRKLLTLQLTQVGYRVLLASNGLEAIALIRSAPPDLVLVDMLMPYFSGLDVLNKLAETGQPIPTILMSAADLPLTQQVVLMASPVNFIAKPFLIETLLAQIDRLLNEAPGPETERPGLAKP
ncbi:response regulator transcription factor [Larkinella insperata]|uniref:Response regulator transcription factor n=1 Tax=Larkinella insperata TaxID=332158 RepID=A0ABW3QMR5_9BACT